MKQIVYIETSIPSFYFDERSEPEMVARRDWTRDWWNNHRHNYILVTSEAVLEELNRDDYPNKAKIKELIAEVALIPAEQQIIEIVQTYIQHKVMPNNPVGDALHLALASFHKCDYLLTWNCSHLANANKFKHIKRINIMLELYTPILTTPFQLLGGEEDYER